MKEQQEAYHLKFYLSLILGASCLWIYSLTLCPTVAGGDSGELVTVAHTMGIAHPPGYPLYTLLAKLFTFIPYGPIAWRVNFFSAFCNTLAALGLFALIRQLVKNSWAALAGAGLYAFSPLIWRYSVVAEVFALNNLLTVAFLAMVARFFFLAADKNEQWKRRQFYWAAGLLGLGASHHHTFLLVALPMGFFCWWSERKILGRPMVIARALLCLGLGLLPYLYLVVAAWRTPLISWSDTSTWGGFWHHFLRKDYGTFRLGAMEEKGQLWQGVIYYLRDTPRELFYFLTPLPFLGLYHLWGQAQGRKIFWAGLSAFVLYLLVFHSMANLPLGEPLFYHVHIRFWQMANVFVFFWAGIGVYWLALQFKERAKSFLPAAVIVALLIQIAVNFKHEDQHENWTTYNLGKLILDVMPQNAIFLSMGDVYTNSIRYLQQCENYRVDVHVLDRELMKKEYFTQLVRKYYPEINMPGKFYRPTAADGASAYNLKAFLEANGGRFAIYAANFKKDSAEANDKRWQSLYYRLPYGLVHRFYRKNVPLDLKRYVRDTDIILSNMKLTKFSNHGVEGYWEHLIAGDYKNAAYIRARQLMYLAQDNHNQLLLKTTIPLLEDIGQNTPNPPWENFKLLGAAYNWLEGKKVGDIKGMLNAWAKYLELAPYDENDRLSIEKSYRLYSAKLTEFLAKQPQQKTTSPAQLKFDLEDPKPKGMRAKGQKISRENLRPSKGGA